MTEPILPIIEYSTQQRRLSWPPVGMALACLALLAVPFIFFQFYEPINEAWTVKHFGCGCPDIRTGKVRFPNANDVNLCLYAMLAIGLCLIQWWLCRRWLRDWPSNAKCVCLGLFWFVILFLCLCEMGKGSWL